MSKWNLRASLDRGALAYEKHLSETFDMEILVDPAWIECRVSPEGDNLRPSGLRFEDEPDEKIVQAFLSRLINGR